LTVKFSQRQKLLAGKIAARCTT